MHTLVTALNVAVRGHLQCTVQAVGQAAGITKHVTYHVSRHTFATMLLTLGADLYTVCKLLGHSDVKTTQIYAKIINKKKEDAISLIDMEFANT